MLHTDVPARVQLQYKVGQFTILPFVNFAWLTLVPVLATMVQGVVRPSR